MKKREQMELRANMIKGYMLLNQCSIRECSSALNIKRSTIHKDIHHLIKYMDHPSYCKILKLLEDNKENFSKKGAEKRWKGVRRIV